MRDYTHNNNPNFSQAAIEKYRLLKKNHNQQSATWAREFHKKQLERRGQQQEYQPAPQVGFGNTYTHTFLGNEGEGESTAENLDYQA